MESKKPYHPIDCNFYDELTLLAVRKTNCEVNYVDESGSPQQIESVIADIFTKDKAEYLRLENGDLCLRLDQVSTIKAVEP